MPLVRHNTFLGSRGFVKGVYGYNQVLSSIPGRGASRGAAREAAVSRSSTHMRDHCSDAQLALLWGVFLAGSLRRWNLIWAACSAGMLSRHGGHGVYSVGNVKHRTPAVSFLFQHRQSGPVDNKEFRLPSGRERLSAGHRRSPLPPGAGPGVNCLHGPGPTGINSGHNWYRAGSRIVVPGYISCGFATPGPLRRVDTPTRIPGEGVSTLWDK